MNIKHLSAIVFMALSFSACEDSRTESSKTSISFSEDRDPLMVGLDSTIVPGDDFFSYANGQWIKNNPIPKSESSWGIANLVLEDLYQKKKAISEEAIKASNPNATQKMIATFYSSGMDTATIESNSLNAIQPLMTMVDTITQISSIPKVSGLLSAQGIESFLSLWIDQDAKASDVIALNLWQGGLGLPDRDYYFNTDEKTKSVREAYPAYIASIFENLGLQKEVSNQQAQQIFNYESLLAQASRKLEDLRDPYANYNKMSLTQLNERYPNLQFKTFFQSQGIPNVDSVIVGQPEFLKALNQSFNQANLEQLKAYLKFHIINELSPYLSSKFSDASFNFYSKKIKGAEEQRERWKRVLDVQERKIGEAIGKIFVSEYFTEKSKKRYEDMVEAVREAYKNRINQLTWMSDSTKIKAQKKLAAITKKVGFPDQWKDFSNMKVEHKDYVLNVLAANQWWHNYSVNKIGKPVDRTEWMMTPQTYNAYYNPSNNEIVLPAGIFLIPGFKDEEVDDAVAYGYAGASTIGHEITHGFDDQGRQYDAEGNLKNWWSKQDEIEFNKRAAVLVEQFNKMVVVNGKTVNGKATLGENLADLGGLLIALDAFKLTEAFKKDEKINGLTPTQRFFLGYALGWQYNIRDAYLESKLLTDVHSPAKQRVNGPMPNINEFYDAFKVIEQNKLYIKDSLRVNLW